TTGALEYQASQRQISASFGKIAHIFEQVHELAPKIEPNSLVLFVIDDGHSPFGGRSFQLIALSRLALGVDAYQAVVINNLARQVTFPAEAVPLPKPPTEPPDRVYHYDYGHTLAFNVSPAATVTLLDRLPGWLLPPGAAVERYQPRAHIQPAIPSRLRFLRLPYWMQP